MSSTLFWRPDRIGNSLPDCLKFALRKKYGYPVKHCFTFNDIGFLEGLLACGMKEAQELIDLIEKHVKIWVEERW